MSVSQGSARKIYDAELLCIEAHTGALHFPGGHQLQVPRLEELRWSHLGEVGVRRIGHRPVDVLRGFIADLCSLHNYFRCPREDGYTSLGSDERRMAQEYFHRAYDIYIDESPDDAQ
jgi:hypothetical protein